MTGLAKCKLPAPLFSVLSADKVMVLPLRPRTMSWSAVRKVPAKPIPLGAVAVTPPTKLMSSDSTPPNCKYPVLLIVTGLATDTLPRRVKANGAPATLKVGVVRPPLKAMP